LRRLAGTGIVAAVAPLSAWAGLAAGFVIALAAALRMAGAVDEADQAVGVIRAERGTHFEPEVVDAFVAAEREVEALAKTLSR